MGKRGNARIWRVKKRKNSTPKFGALHRSAGRPSNYMGRVQIGFPGALYTYEAGRVYEAQTGWGYCHSVSQ
jgi:hypothetical protein